MMTARLFAVIATLVLMLSGCVHEVYIAPKPADLQWSLARDTSKFNKIVAYVITPENKALQISSFGGAGEKIRYQPYRDMESVFDATFSSVFVKASLVRSIEEGKNLDGVDYILVPSIKTESSSYSIKYWPPSDFTMTVSTIMLDKTGTKVWESSVNGSGHIDFKSEMDLFHRDYLLSMHRAITDVAAKMRRELLDAEVLRKESLIQ